MENNIVDKKIPVVAFFGTKGGVGKTTIAIRFAELISQSSPSSDVFLFDFDVNHAGLATTVKGNTHGIRTTHGYIKDRIFEIEKAIDVTLPMSSITKCGKIWALPASNIKDNEIFKTMATIDSDEMYKIIDSLIKSAIDKYKVSCVVIDCGPVVDPYTATAVLLADHAYIIGQNEKISYENLNSQKGRLLDFYPDATFPEIKFIINKVVGMVPKEKIDLSCLIIPFTMSIIEISEGLDNIKSYQKLMFDNYIRDLISITFSESAKELVPPPKALIPKEFEHIVGGSQNILYSKKFKVYKILSKLIHVSILFLVLFLSMRALFTSTTIANPCCPTLYEIISAFVSKIPLSLIALISIAIFSTGYYFNKTRLELIHAIYRILNNKEDALLEMINETKSRKILNNIKKMI